jgi:hypothetical protein
MLKKLKVYLSKQQVIPGIGEFKETLSQVLFWGSIVNYLMVSGTFYYTTLRYIAPWFSLGWFIAAMLIGIIVVFVIEFKYIVPSIWAFRGKQMNLRKGDKKDE